MTRVGTDARRRQAGFSMVEMLMAAFILAIGILGLASLQSISLKAATGSRGLDTGVLLAERVLDQIETNGRNSCLLSRSSPPVAPGAALTSVFTDAPRVPGVNAPNFTCNFAGRTNAGDPIDPNPFFSVYIQPDLNPATPGVVAPVNGLGGIANMTVVVQWTETAGAAPRQVTLSRRVNYATL